MTQTFCPPVSQARLDQLAREIANATVPANAPDTLENNIRHTVFWQKVEGYIAVAPADQVVAMIACGKIPLTDDTVGSALGLAALRHRSDLIEPLISAGCPLNRVGAEDMTPLEHAIANTGPDSSTVAILLRNGAEGSRGESILNYAAYCGHVHNVAAVLDHGADVNAPCPVEGTTALLTAIRELDIGERIAETIKVLLRRGADPTQHSLDTRDVEAMIYPLDVLANHESGDIPGSDMNEIAVLMTSGSLTPTDVLEACARSKTANDDLAAWALANGARIAAPVDGAAETLFQKFAVQGMPRSVQFMLVNCGEAVDQCHPSGQPLMDMVTDEETLQTMRAHVTHAAISDALAPDDRHAPASRPRSALSL